MPLLIYNIIYYEYDLISRFSKDRAKLYFLLKLFLLTFLLIKVTGILPITFVLRKWVTTEKKVSNPRYLQPFELVSSEEIIKESLK